MSRKLRRKVLIALLPAAYDHFAMRAAQRDTTVGRVIKDALMADVPSEAGTDSPKDHAVGLADESSPRPVALDAPTAG